MSNVTQIVEFPPIACDKTPDEVTSLLADFLETHRVHLTSDLHTLRFHGEHGKILLKEHGQEWFSPDEEMFLARFLSTIVLPGKRTAVTFCPRHNICGKEKRGYAVSREEILPFGYEAVISRTGAVAFLNDWLDAKT